MLLPGPQVLNPSRAAPTVEVEEVLGRLNPGTSPIFLRFLYAVSGTAVRCGTTYAVTYGGASFRIGIVLPRCTARTGTDLACFAVHGAAICGTDLVYGATRRAVPLGNTLQPFPGTNAPISYVPRTRCPALGTHPYRLVLLSSVVRRTQCPVRLPTNALWYQLRAIAAACDSSASKKGSHSPHLKSGFTLLQVPASPLCSYLPILCSHLAILCSDLSILCAYL